MKFVGISVIEMTYTPGNLDGTPPSSSHEVVPFGTMPANRYNSSAAINLELSFTKPRRAVRGAALMRPIDRTPYLTPASSATHRRTAPWRRSQNRSAGSGNRWSFLRPWKIIRPVHRSRAGLSSFGKRGERGKRQRSDMRTFPKRASEHRVNRCHTLVGRV